MGSKNSIKALVQKSFKGWAKATNSKPLVDKAISANVDFPDPELPEKIIMVRATDDAMMNDWLWGVKIFGLKILIGW